MIVVRRFMKGANIGKIIIGTEGHATKRRRKQSKDGFNDRNHLDTRVGNK